MKKNLLFDFNLIIYTSIKKDLKTGIYNVEYNVIKQFVENYGDKYNFYACCDCDENYFKKVLNGYPEFKDVQYLNIFSKKRYLKNALKLKINSLRQSKKENKHGTLKIISLKIIRTLLTFVPEIRNKNLDKIDIYLSTTNYMPGCILKDKKIKTFFFIHDALGISNPEYFEKKKSKQNKLKTKFIKLYKSLANKAFLFYNSVSSKEETLRFVPELDGNKNKIVFLAADKKKYFKLENIDDKVLKKYNIPTDKKYILSLCSLNKRKNLPFLIKSYIEFLKRNGDVDDLYLVLAGPSGWMIEKMFEEIDNSGKYRNKIILTGFIDEEDINTVYNGAFCFVFPSFLEGFGLPILEAMTCGLPIISSNTSSMPEVYGDAGVGIDPYNQEELIKALGEFYYKDDYRKAVAEKCLERSNVFSWNSVVKEIEKEM